MPDARFFPVPEPKTLEQLAAHVQGVVRGNKDLSVMGAASLGEAGEKDISFLNNPKYKAELAQSKAGACIIAEKDTGLAPEDMALLIVNNPYVAWAKITALLYPAFPYSGKVASSAHIDRTAKLGSNCTVEPGAVIEAGTEIGDNTIIGAGSYVGRNVVIGKNCKIFPHVTIMYALIGNEVVLHPGVRIGQEGFGFATDKGKHIRIPQLGRVIIEDGADIGANTCVDRGAGPDTVIGAGTMIDNLVQIAHNVKTGKGCVLVSQSGVAGSTTLGDYVVVGGQTAIAGHLNIGSGCSIAGKSGVTDDIKPNTIVGGFPAVPIMEFRRQVAAIKKLLKKKEK